MMERKEGWAQRGADRTNQRQAEKFPLLALSGDLKKCTAQDKERSVEESFARVKRSDERMLVAARRLRAAVERRSTDVEMADYDKRAAMPWRANNPVYLASFWRTVLSDIMNRPAWAKVYWRPHKSQIPVFGQGKR